MINGPFPMVGATLPGPNHRHVTAAPFRWSAGLLGTNAAGASWDLRCQTWGVLECVLSCFVWLILPKDNFVEKIQLGHKLSDLISRWFNHTLNMSMGICIYVYWDVSITITNQRCDSLGCLKIGDSSNHRFHAMIKTMGFWRLNHPMLGDDMTHFDPYSHPGFQWASVVNPWVSEDFINLGRSDLSRRNYIWGGKWLYQPHQPLTKRSHIVCIMNHYYGHAVAADVNLL